MIKEIIAYYRFAILPPSVNRAKKWGSRGSRVVLYPTAELSLWRALPASEGYLNEEEMVDDADYAILYLFYMVRYYKNGTLKRVDVDNRIKYCQDKVADLMGIDDKYLVLPIAFPVDDEYEHTEVYVTRKEDVNALIDILTDKF